MAEQRRSIQQMPNNQRRLSGSGLGIQQITNRRPQTYELDTGAGSQFPNDAGGGMVSPTSMGGGSYANAAAPNPPQYRRAIEAYRQRRLNAGIARAKANGLYGNDSAIRQVNPDYKGLTPQPQRPQPTPQAARQPEYVGGDTAPQRVQAQAPQPQGTVSAGVNGRGIMQRAVETAALGAGGLGAATVGQVPNVANSILDWFLGKITGAQQPVSPVVAGAGIDAQQQAPQQQPVSPSYAAGRGAAVGFDEGLQNGVGSNSNMNVDPGNWNWNSGGSVGGGNGGNSGAPRPAADPRQIPGASTVGGMGGYGPVGLAGGMLGIGAMGSQMMQGIQNAEQNSGLRRNSQGGVVGGSTEYPMGAVATPTVNPGYAQAKDRLAQAQQNQQRTKSAADNGLKGLPFGGSERNTPIEAVQAAQQLETDRAQGRFNNTSKASWEVKGKELDPATKQYHADLAKWRQEQVAARGGVPLGGIAPNPTLLNNAANVMDEDAFNRIAPYMNPQGPMETAHRDNMNRLSAQRYEQLTPAMVGGAENAVEDARAMRAENARIRAENIRLTENAKKSAGLGGLNGANKPSKILKDGHQPIEGRTVLSREDWERRKQYAHAQKPNDEAYWEDFAEANGFDPWSYSE